MVTLLPSPMVSDTPSGASEAPRAGGMSAMNAIVNNAA
jgi:hypothetical protein